MKYDNNFLGLKLKFSKVKPKGVKLQKIHDDEFDITDIFYDVILPEIEHQCGTGELSSFDFSIKPIQKKEEAKLSQKETELCKREIFGEKETN